MKLTIPQLREIVQRALKETKGIQGVYRRSYDKMIKKASTGGNKNTPPFTKKAAKAGKSGLGPF
jgi:hypothetical protein